MLADTPPPYMVNAFLYHADNCCVDNSHVDNFYVDNSHVDNFHVDISPSFCHISSSTVET